MQYPSRRIWIGIVLLLVSLSSVALFFLPKQWTSSLARNERSALVGTWKNLDGTLLEFRPDGSLGQTFVNEAEAENRYLWYKVRGNNLIIIWSSDRSQYFRRLRETLFFAYPKVQYRIVKITEDEITLEDPLHNETTVLQRCKDDPSNDPP